MTHGYGKSDSRVVPKKPPNEVGRPAKEVVEGRGLTKGNPHQLNAVRTQGRSAAPSALGRVRQVARRDKQMRSLRSCTTSTTWIACVRRTWR